MRNLPEVKQEHIIRSVKFTFKRLIHFGITVLGVCAAIQNAWPGIQTSLNNERLNIRLDNAAMQFCKCQTSENAAFQAPTYASFGRDVMHFANVRDYDANAEEVEANNPELSTAHA